MNGWILALLSGPTLLGAASLEIPVTGVMQLPAGTTEIEAEIVLPAAARDLEIRGDPTGSVLKMADHFNGRALFVAGQASRIRFTDFTIDGNRDVLEQRQPLPPSSVPFINYTRNNGILADGVDGLDISAMRFRAIAGFAILACRSRDVRVERVRIQASGSRNDKGRNNTTGGILFEEGTAHFRARNNVLEEIRGNGIWTHSVYLSPRNSDGIISDNRFREIGRDAIQAGHATAMAIERNFGTRIGFPADIADLENQAIPVAIDTAGNVDKSIYAGNHFERIAKCIDLDGFHDGVVRGNTCLNLSSYGIVMNNANPDMQSEKVHIVGNLIQDADIGGIFVIGNDNVVERNRLVNLNRSHSDNPLLRSGIFLGNGGERPAVNRDNIIRDNRISGFNLEGYCITPAEGVSLDDNQLARNICSDRR
jgi:hypothetical protein